MFAPGKSYLVVGEPGTGKSTMILTEARRSGAHVFRWNTRVDRSLREGRESLHTQVRSKETMFIWIEGADDLTQEAQAFMRRILETASKNVTCVLEAREAWKLSQPVLSRCLLITMNQEQSFRKQRNYGIAASLGLLPKEDIPEASISELRRRGADPYTVLDSLKNNTDCLRAVGSGKSPWIQLAYHTLCVSS
jgi:DNA polymerase III delta prime subunit